MKKVFEPVTISIKDVSEYVTKTITETSKENNKALENLHKKLLEILNDGGIAATFLFSPLSKITKTEHTGQLKLVKNPDSYTVNDLLIKKQYQ